MTSEQNRARAAWPEWERAVTLTAASERMRRELEDKFVPRPRIVHAEATGCASCEFTHVSITVRPLFSRFTVSYTVERG